MAGWCYVALCSLALVALCVYAAVKRNYTYWKKKGVPGPTPAFLVGNTGTFFLQRETMGEIFVNIYSQNKHLPHAGVFMSLRRTWLVNDLDMIKTILVKDFAHFTDHSPKFNEKVEPLACHLFNLTGEKWKKLRNKLTPTFTSSKMRSMFETVAKCGKEMEIYLDEENTDALNIKDTIAKFTTDVIGSCAFGLECNSFKNPDAEFRKMGKKIFELNYIRILMQFVVFFVPTLMNKLWFSFIGEEINSFFYNTVDKTIKYREENNIVRNDFMQLLIQLKNDGYVEDEDSGTTLVWQCSWA